MLKGREEIKHIRSYYGRDSVENGEIRNFTTNVNENTYHKFHYEFKKYLSYFSSAHRSHGNVCSVVKVLSF